MNRRQFAKLLALGSAGVAFCGIAKPRPLAFRDTPVTWELTKAWNAHMKGKSSKDMPATMQMDDDLFTAFEDEIVALNRSAHFVAGKDFAPLLKTTRVYRTGQPGWSYWFV